MTPSDIVVLLQVSTLVTVAFDIALIVGAKSLGSASMGTVRWITGDVLLCLSRGMQLAVTHEGVADAFEAALGPWHSHALSMALFIAAAVWHGSALRQASGFHALSAGQLWTAALGLGAIWVAWCIATESETQRVQGSLVVVSVASLVLLRMAWPLARQTWGGRLIAVSLVMPVLHTVVLMALGTDLGLHKPLYQLFFGEMIGSILLASGFLILLQERLRDRILQMSITDALTGAYNRHGLNGIMEREMAIAARSGRPLSLILFDLDHFKQINDRFGHAVGDAVLRGFCERVKSMIRAGDVLARWGGEEFVLLLPDLALHPSAVVADRLRKEVARSPLADGVPIVTVSAGVAERTGAVASVGALAIVQQADARLYEAKRVRNCVVSHDTV